MRKQHGIRRLVLGSLVVLVAALAVLGSGHGASAAKDDGSRPHKGYKSKEDMKLTCEVLGGTFRDDGIGNTSCHYPGYGTVHCDANGKDCWFTPARYQPSGDANSPDGAGEQNESDGGGMGYPGTRGQQLEDRQDVQSTVAAVDDVEEPKAKANVKKGKQGKKHGRGGKGRR